MVGTVVKAKICEFEEEVRAGSSISTRKEFTGVVQGVSGGEEVLGEVSEWVRKESVLKSNHRRDNGEDPGGERT